jgi:hypothetical protein
MRESQRILMRSLDGELGTAEQRASSRLRSIQGERARFELMDSDLQAIFSPARNATEHRNQAVAAICARVRDLPRPQRAVTSWGALLSAVLVMTIAVALLGLMGSVRDMLPLGLVTIVTVGLGGLLLIFARQWRAVEAGLFQRLLRKPIPVTPADVFSYRAVAVVLVAGGIWLSIG